MALLRLYIRVLDLLGKEARLGWLLAVANLLLAVAQFAEPVLFGRIIDVLCFTRDGHVLADCTPEVFAKLRRKRLIESRASSPYRISDRGRRSVRAQLNNR